MKKLFVIFASIICLISACNRGPNPKDSLIAAGNALQNFDANEVDKYIDITSIINNAIDVAAKQEISEFPKEELMQLTAMKVIIVPIVKQYVLEGIKELGQSEYKDYIKMVKVKNYEILSNKDGVASAKVAFDFEELKNYAKEKNLISDDVKAKVSMINGVTPPLIFKMKQNGDYWQIVEISNLEELVAEYERKHKEEEAQAKAEEELKGPLRLVSYIYSAQQRHYLAKEEYTNNFYNLDLDLKTNNGTYAQGDIFQSEGETYSIKDPRKVTAHVTKPQEYTLERYYYDGKTVCQDNGNGMCKKIGL